MTSRNHPNTEKNLKQNPYSKQFITLEKKINKSFQKLSEDIKNHANINMIQKDRNELLILLGECDYIAKECEKAQRGNSKNI